MDDRPETDKDYFEIFKDSSWATSGFDPANEEKVKAEFDDKCKRTRRKIADPGFWDNIKAMYNYLRSGEDLRLKALIVGALLYFISPFDIVPDIIPGLGYIDDIAIIAALAGLFANELHKHRKQ